MQCGSAGSDRKSTRLNSSHTEIYTLSLHDALPISIDLGDESGVKGLRGGAHGNATLDYLKAHAMRQRRLRSEEHTSELQSHRDLHSFPTRRSSDLNRLGR